jgi:hypothetical protein
MYRVSFAVLSLSLGASALPAAAAAPTAYNPQEAFAPLTLPQPVNRYRSGDGAPGPDYWQNRADYDIQARLDPKAKTLSATEVITYANNSPGALPSLWVQLDQNIYRKDSRASVIGGGDRGQAAGEHTDGYVLEQVEVDQGAGWTKADYLVSDTRMNVRLGQPLKGGGKLRLRIVYHYTVPGLFGGRTSWVDSKNGPIFDIAQWFPRMAVYDDVRGWDTLPYIAQEFYLEYGDIDYAVTVPSDMMVMGTGELTNPAEVLTPEQQRRLAAARTSDATVMIRTPQEVARETALPPPAGEKTWRYHMASTRDVAFSASRGFIWDAARINLPGGKTALAESVYPAESQGAAAWGRSTEYLKDAVEHFSQRWFPYPYPTAVNVAGGSEGMEYPGMAFDGIEDKGKELFWITAHEIGHTWFPMTVGSNERRDAWIDEGFNTFIDTFESDEFKGGVYGPKRDSEFAPGGGNPADEIQSVLKDPDAPVIMTRADAISEKYRHPVTYFKSALGLRLLRDVILGPDRFDPAFRKYIADWAFKHPTPSDFFRAMSSEAGEDLDWWWRGWYFNNWNLDLAVANVAYVDGDPAKGANVTVESRDKLVMPSVLEVRYQDGRKLRLNLPVESFILHASTTVAVPGGKIAEVVLDPDHVLPDEDRSNNTFDMAGR